MKAPHLQNIRINCLASCYLWRERNLLGGNSIADHHEFWDNDNNISWLVAQIIFEILQHECKIPMLYKGIRRAVDNFKYYES